MVSQSCVCKEEVDVETKGVMYRVFSERDIGNAFGTDSRIQYISWYSAQREANKPRR